MVRLQVPACPKCGHEAIAQPFKAWVPACQCGAGLVYHTEGVEYFTPLVKRAKEIEKI